jgi:hypothetical protein
VAVAKVVATTLMTVQIIRANLEHMVPAAVVVVAAVAGVPVATEDLEPSQFGGNLIYI